MQLVDVVRFPGESLGSQPGRNAGSRARFKDVVRFPLLVCVLLPHIHTKQLLFNLLSIHE